MAETAETGQVEGRGASVVAKRAPRGSRTRGQRDLNQPQQRLGALQYRTREEKVNSSYLEWEG